MDARFTAGIIIIIIIISNIKNVDDTAAADLPGGEPETTEFQTRALLTYTAVTPGQPPANQLN